LAGVLLLALLLYLVAEIAAFVVVAGHIGVLLAVILVVGISLCGPLLVRRAGTGVIEHARQRITRGETPDREVLDGVVLLIGGVLVCIPGFIGDVLGLLLLIGPVRHAVIRTAGRHLARRVTTATGLPLVFGARMPGSARRRDGAGPVVDAATHDEPDHPHPASDPGRPRARPDMPALPSDPDTGR
jgi:UPF0716 protein FxsA